MLILLSPAKALDYDTPPSTTQFTQPQYIDRAQRLIDILRGKSPLDIAKLMDISDKLAVLNVGRYQSWAQPFNPGNAKQAVLAFNGDVYDGLQAKSLDPDGLDWLQNHLRILSGLYGVLRPLDLMQPYRLEMGSKLANPAGKDLYAYWRGTVTTHLAAELVTHAQPVLVNAASDEYSGAVEFKRLKARVIRPVFKDRKNGQYKIISFFAKTARGLFTRYAATTRAQDVDTLRGFDLKGYAYNAAASDGDNWVFLRDAGA